MTIDPHFFQEIYQDSYILIKNQVDGLSEDECLVQPPWGGNCVNWILGHLIVARCNFLTMLDTASVWEMERCRRYIPGSAPVTSADGAVPIDKMRSDLDRTQEDLLSALTTATDESLQVISGEKTKAEHLLIYNIHEAYHGGQLEILRKMLILNRGNQAA
jgi:hypothetical protein